MTLANYDLLIEWFKPKLTKGWPIVEIGCLGGEGTRKLAMAFPEREIYALDIFDVCAEEDPNLVKLYQEDLKYRDPMIVFLENIHGLENVSIIITDSRDWEPDTFFALAIIDGGHSYDVVLNDLEKTIPVSDYIAVHDYNGDLPQVTRAVDKVVKKYGLRLCEIGNTFVELSHG